MPQQSLNWFNHSLPNNDDLKELKYIKYALDQSAIVAITDKSGMIEYVNDKFVEISKYSREELIGKTHRVINSKFHPKEFFKDVWDTILDGNVWRGEIRNRAKDGSYYWVDTTITPVLDESGIPKKFIAIRSDITKRKELEQQKDDFIGIVSHEFKTPLTSLKGYVQFLEKRFLKQKEQVSAEYLSKMDNQITKLVSLIEDLLDVTRNELGELHYNLEVFDLNELVRDTIESLSLSESNHTLVRQGKIDNQLFGDRDRIGQVLTNFISNATKYSPEADRVIIEVAQKEKQAHVTVTDFGMGIASEEHEKIFQRFYRAKGSGIGYPGLGLGLYISAEIIRRHNGEIWVDSSEGKGSTFGFSLPVISQTEDI